METGIQSLSQREVESLRLLLAGHDAKSAAQTLGLSVHTVNERLRDARRKLGVTSSKEAARLLLEHESQPPEMLGDKNFGVAPQPQFPQIQPHQQRGAVLHSVSWLAGGMLLMACIIAGVTMMGAADVWSGSLTADRKASPLFFQSASLVSEDEGDRAKASRSAKGVGGAGAASEALGSAGLRSAGQGVRKTGDGIAVAEIDLMPFADGNGDGVVSLVEYHAFSDFAWGIVSDGADEIAVQGLDPSRLMGVIGIMPNAHGKITRTMFMASVHSRFTMLDLDRNAVLSAAELNGKAYQAQALAFAN